MVASWSWYQGRGYDWCVSHELNMRKAQGTFSEWLSLSGVGEGETAAVMRLPSRAI